LPRAGGEDLEGVAAQPIGALGGVLRASRGRRDVSFGGVFGGGISFRMSFSVFSPTVSL